MKKILEVLLAKFCVYISGFFIFGWIGLIGGIVLSYAVSKLVQFIETREKYAKV